MAMIAALDFCEHVGFLPKRTNTPEYNEFTIEMQKREQR